MRLVDSVEGLSDFIFEIQNLVVKKRATLSAVEVITRYHGPNDFADFNIAQQMRMAPDPGAMA